jgi:hypothetical protein
VTSASRYLLSAVSHHGPFPSGLTVKAPPAGARLEYNPEDRGRHSNAHDPNSSRRYHSRRRVGAAIRTRPGRRRQDRFISDDGTRDGAYGHEEDFKGFLFDDFDQYWDASPLKYAKNVKTRY